MTKERMPLGYNYLESGRLRRRAIEIVVESEVVGGLFASPQKQPSIDIIGKMLRGGSSGMKMFDPPQTSFRVEKVVVVLWNKDEMEENQRTRGGSDLLVRPKYTVLLFSVDSESRNYVPRCGFYLTYGDPQKAVYQVREVKTWSDNMMGGGEYAYELESMPWDQALGLIAS